MSSLSPSASLKEINAYKKQINWGEVSSIYHIFSSSVGEVDGILTHGFDSAYKQILNQNNWNLMNILDVIHQPKILKPHIKS